VVVLETENKVLGATVVGIHIHRLTTATNSAGALLLRDTTTTITVVDPDLLPCAAAMAIEAGEEAFLLPIIAKGDLIPVVGNATEAALTTILLCLPIREPPAGEVVRGVLLPIDAIMVLFLPISTATIIATLATLIELRIVARAATATSVIDLAAAEALGAKAPGVIAAGVEVGAGVFRAMVPRRPSPRAETIAGAAPTGAAMIRTLLDLVRLPGRAPDPLLDHDLRNRNLLPLRRIKVQRKMKRTMQL
jgi:hypothetical protein